MISEREMHGKIERIKFLTGYIEGVQDYAIWKNGEQLVGCLQKPLREVLKPYREEIYRLTEELSK